MALYPHTLVVLVYRCLISLVGIPGNMLVLAVYWNKQSLGSAQVFIQTLALSDLHVCMLLPLEMHFWLNEYKYTNLNLCRAYYTASAFGWFMSIFVTCATALDRYIAVANPVNGRWTRRRAQQVAIACAFVAIFVNLAQPFSSTIGIRELNGVVNGTYCMNKGGSGAGIFFLVTITQYSTCLIAFAFIFVVYFMLWRTVNQQSKKIDVKLVHCGKSIPNDDGSMGGTQIEGIDDSVSQEPRQSKQRVDSSKTNADKSPVESSPRSENRMGENQQKGVLSNTDPETNQVKGSHNQPSYQSENIASDGKNEMNSDRHQPKPVRRSRPAMSRLTMMLLLTTVIFFITWGITLVVFGLSSVVRRLPGDSVFYALFMLIRYVNLVNNAINPFLYSLLNPRFRTDCELLYKRLKSRLARY